MRQRLNLADICVRKQVYAVHLCIQSFPLLCACSHGMSPKRQAPLSLR